MPPFADLYPLLNTDVARLAKLQQAQTKGERVKLVESLGRLFPLILCLPLPGNMPHRIGLLHLYMAQSLLVTQMYAYIISLISYHDVFQSC